MSDGDFKLHLVFGVLLSRSNATTRADYGEPCRAKTAKRLFGYKQVANTNCEYPLESNQETPPLQVRRALSEVEGESAKNPIKIGVKKFKKNKKKC